MTTKHDETPLIETPKTDALVERLVLELEAADKLGSDAAVTTLQKVFRELVISHCTLECELAEMKKVLLAKE